MLFIYDRFMNLWSTCFKKVMCFEWHYHIIAHSYLLLPSCDRKLLSHQHKTNPPCVCLKQLHFFQKSDHVITNKANGMDLNALLSCGLNSLFMDKQENNFIVPKAMKNLNVVGTYSYTCNDYIVTNQKPRSVINILANNLFVILHCCSFLFPFSFFLSRTKK